MVQRARATGNLHFAPWDAMSKALWERSESKNFFFSSLSLVHRLRVHDDVPFLTHVSASSSLVCAVCCCIVGCCCWPPTFFQQQRGEKKPLITETIWTLFIMIMSEPTYILRSLDWRKNNTGYKDEARRANNMERRRAKTFSAAAVIVVTSDTLRFTDDALHWSRSGRGDDIILSEWKELFLLRYIKKGPFHLDSLLVNLRETQLNTYRGLGRVFMFLSHFFVCAEAHRELHQPSVIRNEKRELKTETVSSSSLQHG